MPRQLSRTHKKGRKAPLVILFGLMTLLALPAGAGLLGPAARAASASDINPAFAAAVGCSSADFKAPRTFDLSGSQNSRGTPTDIALGDFNGDGRTDMAVSHSGQSGVSPTVSIMLDDGAGGYTAATPISYFPATILYRV